MNRKTTVYYFQRLCEIIAMELDGQVDEILQEELELDASYFDGKGKRGRGAGEGAMLQEKSLYLVY